MGIEAKELRIGNIVYSNQVRESGYPTKYPIGEFPFTITAIIKVTSDIYDVWLEGVEQAPIDGRSLTGIPLTPEILEKCGFVKESQTDTYVLPQGNKLFQISWDTKTFVIYDPDFETGSGVLLTHVHYLHQLQNLYFVLYGEELTYSP